MPDEFQTLKKESSIEIIKACNGSGMPKRQWCREHGIGYSTFMRWQRSLRNELAGEIMVTQAAVVCSFDSKPQTELYVLQSYTVKEIDQYLWQLGKANFPKKYWRCVYGKRKKRAKHLSGGDVHFVKTTVTPPPWLALPLIEQKYHFVQLDFPPPDDLPVILTKWASPFGPFLRLRGELLFVNLIVSW